MCGVPNHIKIIPDVHSPGKYSPEDYSSRPTVQYVSSLAELPQALQPYYTQGHGPAAPPQKKEPPRRPQPYYTQGYVLAALHPIILSVGRTRSLPFSLLYRAVLARPRLNQQTASMCHSVPVLRVEEWPLPGDSLTGFNNFGGLSLPKVNSSARGGVRFVGSVLQQVSVLSNGSRLHSPKRGCRSPPHTPPRTPPGDRELEDTVAYSPGETWSTSLETHQTDVTDCHSFFPDMRLLVFFHSWAPGCAPLESLACQYHQGALSMRVSRKGQVVSALEADWLELTAAYYRRGWSLVDSFVYWDTPKGRAPPSAQHGSHSAIRFGTSCCDCGCGPLVKTDYGPLLHTLAEFGWLLTCVLPTPIIRHDSDGNLATKQVVFLQRPVRSQAAAQHRNQVLSVHCDVSSRSVSGAALRQELSPVAGGIGGFPAFGAPSSMSHLEEGCFDQEEGKAEVTCM
uniref:Raftlin family member 2 n=1 Tax=Hippocampus comes TaxID=109280 RepID=A0A3Q2YE30_HIPCM